MELLLWRWSTTAQIASALMIAVFFIVLTRSVRRSELQLWVNAWLANLAALAVTVIHRLDTVRDRLKAERVRGHQIGFSAGHAYLAVHGDSEAAMKAADEAMYAEKARKPGGRRRTG